MTLCQLGEKEKALSQELATQHIKAPGEKTELSSFHALPSYYTFNPNNDGKAGTFLESYSLYKEYNASGSEINERQYASGTLTVTDDLVKLEVTFTDDTNIYIVTYSGNYTILDQRQWSGSQN